MTRELFDEAKFIEKLDELLNDKKLNQVLLDSFPYPAMIIRSDRRIVSANKTAKDMGVKVGSYCWDTFGKKASITNTDREYFEKMNNVPPEGIKCTFCKANEALASQSPINEKIPAGEITYDTYWVPLTEDVYFHYALADKEVHSQWALKVQEIANLGLWIQYPESNQLWWSDKTFEILGLKPQPNAPLWDQFLEMVRPEDRRKIIKKTELALKSDEYPYKVSYRVIRPDNSERIVNEEAIIERNENGTPVKITGIIQDVTEQRKIEIEKQQLINELKNEIKTLRGILPICSHCHHIRDDKGAWNQLEEYISEHTDATFSHGICPDCLKKHYPEEYEAIMNKVMPSS